MQWHTLGKAHLVLVVHLLLLAHLVGGHVQRLNEIKNKFVLRKNDFKWFHSHHLFEGRAKCFHFRTLLHVEKSQSWRLWGVKN